MTKRQKTEPLPVDTAKVRIAWLKRKEAKVLADYHFANGYRAGIECAVRAITKGEDILGNSIDEGKAEIR